MSRSRVSSILEPVRQQMMPALEYQRMYNYSPSGTTQMAPSMPMQAPVDGMIDPSYLAQLAILNQPQVLGTQFQTMGSGLMGMGPSAQKYNFMIPPFRLEYPDVSQTNSAMGVFYDGQNRMSGLLGNLGNDYPNDGLGEVVARLFAQP